MANIVTAVFAIALVIGGAVMLTGASLNSASEISMAWDQKTERTGRLTRTRLTLIDADIQGSGTNIDISVRNTGQTALNEFSDWDVIIRYYQTSGNQDLDILSLAYTANAQPSSGEWTISGLYLDVSASSTEVYDPNILNPGEEAIFRVTISPAIATSTDSVIRIGTPNGVTVDAPFSR